MNGCVRTLTPNEIESFQLRVPPPSLFLLLLPRSYQCPRSKGRNVFSHAEIPPSIAFVGIASSRTPTTSVWRAGIINVHFEATSDVVLGTLVFWNKCPLRTSTYRYIGTIGNGDDESLLLTTTLTRTELEKKRNCLWDPVFG